MHATLFRLQARDVDLCSGGTLGVLHAHKAHMHVNVDSLASVIYLSLLVCFNNVPYL